MAEDDKCKKQNRCVPSSPCIVGLVIILILIIILAALNLPYLPMRDLIDTSGRIEVAINTFNGSSMTFDGTTESEWDRSMCTIRRVDPQERACPAILERQASSSCFYWTVWVDVHKWPSLEFVSFAVEMRDDYPYTSLPELNDRAIRSLIVSTNRACAVERESPYRTRFYVVKDQFLLGNLAFPPSRSKDKLSSPLIPVASLLAFVILRAQAKTVK